MSDLAFFKDRKLLVDEVELRLLAVLQANPLISWEVLGRLTGISARSAARRVEQMQEKKIFWFVGSRTCGPTGAPLTEAIILVNTAGRNDYELFGELANNPKVLTIERATYSVDAILRVNSSSLNQLLVYDLPLIRQTVGVSATRTLPIIRTFRDRSDWRLSGPVEMLDSGHNSSPVRRAFTPAEDHILTELVLNPRISMAEISRKVDLTASRVRQIVDQALASEQIKMGINIDPKYLGLDAECCYFLQLNQTSLPKLLRKIETHAFIQYCHLTAGEVNTVLSVCSTSLEELELVQQILLSNQPQVKIKESIITFGTTKLQGWVQEAQGYMPVCFPQEEVSGQIPTNNPEGTLNND